MAEFCFCTGNPRELSFKAIIEKMTPTDNYEQVFDNISFGHNSCNLLVKCGHLSLTGKLLLYLMLYRKIPSIRSSVYKSS